MVEEIDIKTIQKAKANAEKVKKVEQRKKDKEEVKQENKMMKIKKNTCLNKSAAAPVPKRATHSI